jgi:hypothetical protein
MKSINQSKINQSINLINQPINQFTGTIKSIPPLMIHSPRLEHGRLIERGCAGRKRVLIVVEDVPIIFLMLPSSVSLLVLVFSALLPMMMMEVPSFAWLGRHLHTRK